MISPLRRLLPGWLTSLAGLACLACCAPPFLAAGIVSGTGWALLGQAMPGIAVALVAAAITAGWWSRRHCACETTSCGC